MRTVNVLLVISFLSLFGIWSFMNNERQDIQITDNESLTTLIEDLLESSGPQERVVAPVPMPRLERSPVERSFGEVANLQISDGNFSELSQGWRNGIEQIVEGNRCLDYDYLIMEAVDGDRMRYLLTKAQMLVESNCKPDAFGGGVDIGLLQVQEPTCTQDVGVEGDLFDPKTNIECAVGYLTLLDERYGRSELHELFVAYNAGPTGALRISNPKSFQYVRKIHFAFNQLLKQEQIGIKV